jgi:glycosyltransferase involved in cell wall biosynthesis
VFIVRAFEWGKAIRAVRAADVISAQDPFETGLLAFFFALVFDKRLHMQVHTDFFASGFLSAGMRHRLRRFVAPFILRRADRIRVVSESIKESIEKRIAPKAPTTVLPIFVDTTRLQNMRRTKHPQFKIALLAVSRLEKEKNIGLAIAALQFARGAGHDAGLTIVGSGSEEGRLKAQARSLGLERFVLFAGEGDPAPHYASADALLVPSFYEGYGMVIIEALSAGIPVIATDVGIAREAGAIVSSTKDFSKTLIRWIESGPRQATLVSYPYSSFEEYVQRYCDDLSQTA